MDDVCGKLPGPLSRSGFECSPSAFIGWVDHLLGFGLGFSLPTGVRGQVVVVVVSIV